MGERQDEKKPVGFKESLYDKIPLTKRHWDIIVGVLIAALVVFLVLGILDGNGII